MQLANESPRNLSKIVWSGVFVAATKMVARFRDDRSGNAAILFGLALIPMVFLGGMALDFSSAIQKRNLLNAAADAAALAAVTPAMLQQPVANAQTAAENMFNAETSAIPGLIINSLNVNVGTSGLTRTVTVSYTASSVNSFAGVLGQTYWPISSGSSESSPQASSSAAANINFYLLLDNSPSMDLPATSAGITAMINATKNAPSNGGNAGGCAFACHESDPAADNLGNPGGIDNYQLAQNLGVVTRIQNMASATQSLMTTAASTEASNNATYQVAIYTFEPSGVPSGNNGLQGLYAVQQLTSNLTTAQGGGGQISTCLRCIPTTRSQVQKITATLTRISNPPCRKSTASCRNPGTGGASSTPQEVLFIVSDGVEDEIDSTCTERTVSARREPDASSHSTRLGVTR